MPRTIAILGALGVFGIMAAALSAQENPTLGEALKKVRVLAVPRAGRPVDRTVAEEMRRLAPQAEIEALDQVRAGAAGVFRIAVADEKLAAGPSPEALRKAGDRNKSASWMFLRLGPDGSGELTASAPHLLYALFSCSTTTGAGSRPRRSRRAGSSCPASRGSRAATTTWPIRSGSPPATTPKRRSASWPGSASAMSP